MKEEIGELMTRAYDCLSDADYLLRDDRLNRIPNCCYYAVFDAISALLRTENLFVKTHKGAKNKFSELFVKTGRMPDKSNEWLEKCYDLRQSGDYNFSYDVNREDALMSIKYAKEFLLCTEAYLRSQNLVN